MLVLNQKLTNFVLMSRGTDNSGTAMIQGNGMKSWLWRPRSLCMGSENDMSQQYCRSGRLNIVFISVVDLDLNWTVFSNFVDPDLFSEYGSGSK